jgi:glycosyltransferase involved in cell wall biosynthesis
MDFAGKDQGVIMTIWDLSRLDWFARPKMGGPLNDFLMSGRFKKWAYIPIDHQGISGEVTGMCRDTLLGFDRILAYTLFGKKVLEQTLQREVDWIPHGINGSVFRPRDRQAGRLALGVKEDEELIGCVMTNQARKDWGTAFATAARLARPGRKFWFHTDALVRHWNLMALANDFGLEPHVIITTNTFTSEELSYLYSACNITYLPSLGEGFGYPLVESLGCGIPVIHGNYAGGAELIPEREWLVEPVTYRLDTQWNCMRPVWDVGTWKDKVEWALNQHGDGTYQDICTTAVRHLDWKRLWPSCWKKWFEEGIE